MGPRKLGIPSLGGVVTEFASDGTARIHFRCAPNLHRVPDGVLMAALPDQLFAKVGAEWIACLITNGGHGVIRPSGPGVPQPDKQLQSLLVGMAIALNRHEARGGHWVTGLKTDDHDAFGIWRDGDGDIHAVVFFGEPATIAAWSDTDFGAHACEALNTVAEARKALELKPQHQIRLALGQKPTRH
jgi:hypothetical protein